ncbi:probable C-mannosyltransferase DPY19L1 [Spea bombifrons]|uniref:probable C-mannosyltransferase DPY19L1 n=1 Tax=Spea bombifrons TaxID=233779 RepID=UPI00234B6D6F|nr:probable C-mannosyltransferase DPY19L1 [Spea bombifrons]
MAVETRLKPKDQRHHKQQHTSPSSDGGTGEKESGIRQRHGLTSHTTTRARNRTHHWGTDPHHPKQRTTTERLFFCQGLSKAANLKTWTILLFAALAGILHWSHISTLFENDRHFSHLSTLEREMAFRTEMGLYYSYFKTITEAPSYYSGLLAIMNDNVTEYPNVINTLKRFNLYPEVILASWYRIYTTTMNSLGFQTKICWKVNRGDDLSPVDSCEGLGDPAYFYVTMIFILNGMMMSLFYIYGTYLSGSRLGGFVTVLCFFFNHGECTRVMWTPPLRESFSYPFLVLQMFLLTYILRTPNVGRRSLIALCVSNVFFMLPWQFAQFVLLTQIASLFAIYIVGFIDQEKILNILYTHMISLGLCFILMFGNSMLLTSYYASSLAVICVIAMSRKAFLKLQTKEFVLWILQVIAWIFGTIILKALTSLLLGVKDDAHIGNILKSKFTSYKDFDTLMYTCAPEFDFMEKETPWRYLKTLLLPVVLLVFATICLRAFKDIQIFDRQKTIDLKGHRHERQEYSTSGELVYHALQLVAFAVLAILIMRLKLFLTPHMCVMASLLCSRQLFGWIFNRFQPHLFLFAMMALMTIQGFTNLQNEWNIKGEFSNLPQEELLEWIQTNTKSNAVFAGAMPTMASVKLSTGRPIVNHPHYEDAGLRARTKMVYSMYSRKPAKEVKRILRKLGVQYFILEDAWCTRRPKPGCSMSEIWDIEDPANAGKPPLCSIMAKEFVPQFQTSFQNSVYKVLKLLND